jgi:ABC-type sugar transport system substrate-binding protein
MKKILVFLLALALVFSAAACGGQSAGDSGASTAANTTAAPNTTAASGNSAPAPASGGEVGTIDEEVDYFARPAYKFVYAHYDNNLLEQQMYDAFMAIAPVYNFELTRMSGDTDDETYVTNLETLIDRGDIDGFIIETTNSVQNAVLDLMNDCGIPYVNLFTEYFDAGGKVVTPTIGLPQRQTGYESLKYLTDHYKEYWGDVDTGEIGLITIDFSVSTALNDRILGIEDAFREAFPGNENIFYNDSFAAGQSAWFTLEGGYDPTAQTISSHPEVKYWMVSSCLENYSQGAARAADDLNRNDTMLISTVGHPMLEQEWDNGYDGAWKCAVAISNYAYATPEILGLTALCDGRATPETLWPEFKKEGDQCAVWYADYSIVTKDTYKAYLAEIDAKYGPK